MGAYRRKVFAVAVKTETTEGVDAGPALGTDAVRVMGIPTLKIQTLESGARPDAQHAGMGRLGRAKPAGRWGSIELTLEIRGKGSAYSALPASAADFEHDPFLRGSHLVRSYATGKVTYTTADAGTTETFSLALLAQDGKVYHLVGCVAKPKLALVAGQTGRITYAVEGRMLVDPVDGAISGLVQSAVIPPIWSDTLVTIGSVSTATAAPNTLVPRKLDVDFQTESTARPWAGAGALVGHAITDRNIRLTMDIEVMPLAAFNPFLRAMEAGGGVVADTSVTTSLPGGTGNTFDLRTGLWDLEQPDDSDFNGLAGWSLAGDLEARSIASGLGAGREIALSIS
jgi:hypothetical protein